MKTLNKKLSISAVFICIIFTIYLWFTGFNGYYQIATQKWYAFVILTTTYSILSIITFIKYSKTYISNVSTIQWFAIAYITFSWISWAFSNYKHESLIGLSRNEGMLTISLYVLCFLFISSLGEINIIELKALSIGTIVFCIIGIVQFWGFNIFLLYPLGMNYYGANIDYSGTYISTIGNIDFASAFLCPTAVLFTISSFKVKGRDSILCILAAILSLYVLIRINVASGILAYIVTIILSLPFSLKLSKSDKKKLLTIICIAIIISLLIVFIFDSSQAIWHELHEIMHGRIEESFGSGRIKIWKEVFKLSMEKPLFGYGADTMIEAQIEPWTRYIEKYETQFVANIDAAHNEYLNIFYHQGIFAAIAFLGIIVSSIIMFIKKECKSTESLLLISFICAYSVQAFFNISTCMSSIYFWIALGLFNKSITEKAK